MNIVSWSPRREEYCLIRVVMAPEGDYIVEALYLHKNGSLRTHGGKKHYATKEEAVIGAEQMQTIMTQQQRGEEFSVPSPDAPIQRDAPVTVAAADVHAYFIGKNTGRTYPVTRNEVLIGRYDSVTGHRPEVDLTDEDTNRNVSRRHARLVLKDGAYHVAEEIGTMNGTFINGKKLPTGILTPISDGDELLLCRVPMIFKIGRKPA